MQRILFVSRQFPSDIAKSVHGTYLRMRLFLDALAELAECLDVLSYVEPGIEASPAAMRKAEEKLRAGGASGRTSRCVPLMSLLNETRRPGITT